MMMGLAKNPPLLGFLGERPRARMLTPMEAGGMVAWDGGRTKFATCSQRVACVFASVVRLSQFLSLPEVRPGLGGPECRMFQIKEIFALH